MLWKGSQVPQEEDEEAVTKKAIKELEIFVSQIFYNFFLFISFFQLLYFIIFFYTDFQKSPSSYFIWHETREVSYLIGANFTNPKTGRCAWTNQSTSQGPLGTKLSPTSTKRIETCLAVQIPTWGRSRKRWNMLLRSRAILNCATNRALLLLFCSLVPRSESRACRFTEVMPPFSSVMAFLDDSRLSLTPWSFRTRVSFLSAQLRHKILVKKRSLEISLPIIDSRLKQVFVYFLPPEVVNFHLKSLLETTFAQSKQICSFDDGDTHTRSIDLVRVESANSAIEAEDSQMKPETPNASHATPHFWREMQMATLQARQVDLSGLRRSPSAPSRPKKARSARRGVDL